MNLSEERIEYLERKFEELSEYVKERINYLDSQTTILTEVCGGLTSDFARFEERLGELEDNVMELNDKGAK